MESMCGVSRLYECLMCFHLSCFAVGADWEKAKTQTEVRLIPLSYYGHLSSPLSIQCLDYLFEISVKMKSAGLPTLLV